MHLRHMRARSAGHTQVRQLLNSLLLQILGVGRKNMRRAFQNQHIGRARIDVPEVLRHIQARDVGDRAG